MLYAGDNDLSWPWLKSPDAVLTDFKRFVEIIHAALPETWVYYVAMRPAPLGWTNASKLRETNRLIETFTHTQDRVEFVDINSVMLNEQGQPRRELFRWDGLHMNAQGYRAWTSVIRPLLMKRFGSSVEFDRRLPTRGAL